MDYKYKKAPQKKEGMLYGIQPVLEAIESGKEIEKIFIQKDATSEQLTKLLQIGNKMRIPMVKVPVYKLEKITRKNHQGVVAFLSAVEYASLDNIITQLYQDGKDPFLLVLDRITDVRNFGAIARTAECAGVNAIIIPSKGAAQIGADALKTSAGALTHIPVCRESSLVNTLKYLKDNGIQVIGCTDKAVQGIGEVDYNTPLAIVLGSEEDGISGDLLKVADEIVKIPMHGKINSLNVSVSAGIVLYEALRARK